MPWLGFSVKWHTSSIIRWGWRSIVCLAKGSLGATSNLLGLRPRSNHNKLARWALVRAPWFTVYRARLFSNNRAAANALAWVLHEVAQEKHFALGVALDHVPGEGLAGGYFELTRTDPGSNHIKLSR